MRGGRFVTLALVALTLGCVAAPADPPAALPGMPTDAAWALAALPFGEQHDHQDRAQHANLSTPNFDVIGWNPLVSPTIGSTPGGHFCGDAQDVDGGRRLAAVEQRAYGGFVLMDVTNPAAPEPLGELIMRGSRVYDLAVTPDGEHVVLVTTDQLNTPALPVAPRLEWRSRCADDPVMLPIPALALAEEDPVPRPSSIILVDVSDPAAPAIVDQRALPMAGHSVFPAVVDGRDILLVTALVSGNGYYQFYELAQTPVGRRLVLLSTYGQETGNDLPDQSRFEAHDGWLAQHPATGQTLAYLAGGRHFTIVDASDLMQPREIGRWSDWALDRDAFTGHMHSVVPLAEMWGERHFTVVGPEYGGHPGEQPSGTMWVLDTTDPSKPFAVGAWTLPHDVEWSDVYMFSNHYFTVHGRTAFVSMYHGGVWAVDLSPVATAQNLTLLDSVGAFLPDRVSPAPPESMIRWTPTVQEVFAFPDGTIVLFDGSSGIYTVRFDASRPAPAPEPWPILAPPVG